MVKADDECVRIADESVAVVARWLDEAAASATATERRAIRRLGRVVTDRPSVAFAMKFVDRVIRAEAPEVAATQFASLVKGEPLPAFLSTFDRALLRLGAFFAPRAPRLVIPLAKKRLRQLVGHLVVDADPDALRRHLSLRRQQGFRLNVNLLGEAVLGQREADRRMGEAIRLLDEPDIDYVSVKLSALVPQLNYWDYDTCLTRVCERLRVLFAHGASTSPPTFVNLDMEEYHDLQLTVSAFTAVLGEPEFRDVSAGIVLQAYLPDSFAALQTLVHWATTRRETSATGAPAARIKIRLVKGANLAMERVDAAMHGWPQAPYETKADTDANYKRCLDWVLTPEHTDSVQIGLASHNLFDVAWAIGLADARGVADRVEVEMLEGMAPVHARELNTPTRQVLLYTPVVAATEFDVAISYLFRRLEENSSPQNFIHHLSGLRPGTSEFDTEAAKFRAAVRHRATVSASPRRRPSTSGAPGPAPVAGQFVNEPNSDPALAATRAWAREVASSGHPPEPAIPHAYDLDHIDGAIERAVAAQPAWAAQPAAKRRQILHRLADRLANRRGDLVAAMMHEGRKPFAEADPEVSEAIDFARWYGDRALDLGSGDAATFHPIGLITVASPWNFPVAIPAGGALAALAAGNAVLLKPAPETPRCAALIAQCCWEAGIPHDVLQLVAAPDDELGRRLITHPDVGAVILTGAYETADLFRSWRPDLALFAETSGKNALIITPSADIDLAVADLVQSAFGHSGQKCSAVSLAICVGQTYDSARLRRQLIDAVTSMQTGEPTDLGTDCGPLITAPGAKLERALTTRDSGEAWLVEPKRIDERVWTPGIRLGVRPGSWFHQTECFGPVLGMMHATSLNEAIALANATPYGLTGGLHSLDPGEIDHWTDSVEVGNGYVNRTTTGAIVRRQPFGGWKRSAIGPGAKAGGPNYVSQLGTWRPANEPRDAAWLAAARRSDDTAWRDEFGIDHDPTGLFCESNVFRYRPVGAVALRVESSALPIERERVLSAASRCGVGVLESTSEEETADAFAARLATIHADEGVTRIRVLGQTSVQLRAAANALNVQIMDGPVTRDGRRELQHYLREQTISRTRHRYGNLVV